MTLNYFENLTKDIYKTSRDVGQSKGGASIFVLKNKSGDIKKDISMIICLYF